MDNYTVPKLIVEDEVRGMDWSLVSLVGVAIVVAGAFFWALMYWVFIFGSILIMK